MTWRRPASVSRRSTLDFLDNPMNSRDRVRAALTCRTPDRIPMALAFWEESLPAIAPSTPAEHFGLDVRFVEFAPPDDQQDFLHYLGDLPPDVHVGDLSQLRIYHEWRYHPELSPDGPLASARFRRRARPPHLPRLSRSAALRRAERTGRGVAFPGLGSRRQPAASGRRAVRERLPPAGLRQLPRRSGPGQAARALPAGSVGRAHDPQRPDPGARRHRHPATG